MICSVCNKEIEVSTERIKIEKGIKSTFTGAKGNKIEKDGNVTVVIRNVEKCGCGLKLPKIFNIEDNTDEPTISIETEWVDGEVVVPGI